jgi:pyruvate,orthophosphate dikinase
MKQYVYAFHEGNKNMREILGGKGANLAEMINIGLPVPDGFTVSTEACNNYYDNNEVISEDIKNQILNKLKELEENSGKKLGDINKPLLVSVRSGSRASMPGMMDTVLNLGLNDEVVKGFAASTNNPRFAYDSYRRFIQMFADVVKGYPKASFEHYFDHYKEERGIKLDTDITAEQMMEIVEHFKENYEELAGETFPQDPVTQLMEAIEAVFKSWNNERAIVYRRMNDIPSSWGTAVNVQEMVYGNSGDNSGTGVAFTRNPSTGENKLYGEYLINAQGEDVVAGIRTPEHISTLEEKMPEVYKEFHRICEVLEQHYKDMQDLEFTIEDGKLFILQTRNGKRTAAAALKIAVDLVNEGLITKEEAILSINPKSLDALLHPMFDETSLKAAKEIGSGLAASPGAATGQIYFTAEDAVNANKEGIDVILVRLETSPEDIEGMDSAKGILTLRGGMTSHAAVVARGMGKCCVSGCDNLKIEGKTLITKENELFKEGDYISLNGTTGKVYSGQIKTVEAEISDNFEIVMNWADEIRTLGVRTNADTPKEALQAKEFGAEGVGLCRTEHMFFEESRIFAVRQMIIADIIEEREKALAKILPMQRGDFESIFKAMSPMPVTIRYLDPPLHEFLPTGDKEIEELAKELNVTKEVLTSRIESLKEVNPMMGHRGLRLAITYPEIARMQTRAVIEAAINVTKEGLEVTPEIMIPLASDSKELKYVSNIVKEEADKIIKENNSNLKYHVGTMVEIPRACLTANELAETAEFFSFGTNDLTQMTYGFSRDDAGKFLDEYYKKTIFDFDPFARIDEKGVGELVKIAIERGKSTNPNLHLGICGEHGGDPLTVEFCHNVGLDYVSCSPYRVPIARLSAAIAQIKNPK